MKRLIAAAMLSWCMIATGQLYTPSAAVSSTTNPSSGNIGAGTSTPLFRIHALTSSPGVAAFNSTSTGNTGNIAFLNNSNWNYGMIGVVSGTGGSTGDVFGLGYNPDGGTTFNNVLNWTSGAKVGIGMVPNFKFQVHSTATGVAAFGTSVTGNTGNISIVNGSNFNYGVMGVVSGTGYTAGDVYGLGWSPSSNSSFNTVLNWTSEGRVGIGTITPDKALTVSGGFRAYATISGDAFDIRNTFASAEVVGADVDASSTSTSKMVYGVLGRATSNFSPDLVTAVGVYGEADEPSGDAYAGWFNGDLAYSGDFGLASDSRLKEEVQDLTNSLEALRQLKPRTFYYKRLNGYHFPQGQQAGFIAQEVQTVLPGVVKSGGLPLPGDTARQAANYLTVNYIKLLPYIVNAIQEQQSMIDEQASIISSILQKDSVESSLNLRIQQLPHIVKIHPNPSQHWLSYDVFTNGKPGVIFIYNRQGEVVMNVEVIESSGFISLDGVDDGIYIFALYIRGTAFDTKRFMVSK